MKREAFVMIPRSLFESDLWDKCAEFSQEKAIFDLAYMASVCSKKVPSGGQMISVNRWDIVTTLDDLVERWDWNRSRVRRFLDKLKIRGTISTRVEAKKIIITLDFCIKCDKRESLAKYEHDTDTKVSTISTPYRHESEHDIDTMNDNLTDCEIMTYENIGTDFEHHIDTKVSTISTPYRHESEHDIDTIGAVTDSEITTSERLISNIKEVINNNNNKKIIINDWIKDFVHQWNGCTNLLSKFDIKNTKEMRALRVQIEDMINQDYKKEDGTSSIHGLNNSTDEYFRKIRTYITLPNFLAYGNHANVQHFKACVPLANYNKEMALKHKGCELCGGTGYVTRVVDQYGMSYEVMYECDHGGNNER